MFGKVFAFFKVFHTMIFEWSSRFPPLFRVSFSPRAYFQGSFFMFSCFHASHKLIFQMGYIISPAFLRMIFPRFFKGGFLVSVSAQTVAPRPSVALRL